MDKKTEGIRNAIGVTAEMSLLFYRATIGAGATPAEALKLTQAYIAAMNYGGNQQQKPEGE